MNNTNRLLFGKTSSIAATVARAIERAEIDPRYISSQITAHKVAWVEKGASFDHQLAAEVADMDVMRQCSRFPGGAFMFAQHEAGRAL